MVSRLFLQCLSAIKTLQVSNSLSLTGQILSKHKWLISNVFLCGGTSFVADVTSQYICQDDEKKFQIEWDRVWAFTATSIILAPTVHYWYIFLDNVVIGTSVTAVAKKLAYDSLMFSPLYIFLFYCCQSIFERKHFYECFHKLHTNGPILWISESISWIPIQIVNFRFVALRYRVLYDNVISFCFDILYSSVYHTDEILPLHY
nr:mpv17 protein 2 [Hymenolepis microstoma]